jgi:exopolyphosphatase/guanosine-5'-triphosphate,3'-diphosphate pyrophosphatase
VRAFAARARALGASHLWAVGTLAFRRAVDGPAFAAELAAEIAAPVDILSADREAELGFEGAVSGLAGTDGLVLGIDVGGGSTELVRGTGGAVVDHVSLPVGAVVLSEAYLRHDPPLTDEILALRRAVASGVAAASPVSGHDGSPPTVVGSGGTVTTMAAMARSLDRYRPEVVHGSRLSADVVRGQVAELARRSVAERLSIAGLDPARATTILAGALVVEAVLEAIGASSILVSDHGLRHAVLCEKAYDSGLTASRVEFGGRLG